MLSAGSCPLVVEELMTPPSPPFLLSSVQEHRITHEQAEALGLVGGGRDGIPPPRPPPGVRFVNPVPPLPSYFSSMYPMDEVGSGRARRGSRCRIQTQTQIQIQIQIQEGADVVSHWLTVL